VRFVPIAGDQPAVATAVVTRRDTTHLPTAAFLRATSEISARRPLVARPTPAATVA
jgi:hypothetical protein